MPKAGCLARTLIERAWPWGAPARTQRPEALAMRAIAHHWTLRAHSIIAVCAGAQLHTAGPLFARLQLHLGATAHRTVQPYRVRELPGGDVWGGRGAQGTSVYVREGGGGRRIEGNLSRFASCSSGSSSGLPGYGFGHVVHTVP